MDPKSEQEAIDELDQELLRDLAELQKKNAGREAMQERLNRYFRARFPLARE